MTSDCSSLKLDFKLSPGRVYAGHKNDQPVRLLFSVRASDELRTASAGLGGLDLCLVLDISSSMEDCVGSSGLTKLQMAVQAVQPLLALLRKNDTMSVVVFADQAQVIASDLQPTSTADYQRAIGTLQPSGRTAMGTALRAAAAHLRSRPVGRVRKILMLTDGQATDGDAAPNAAKELGAEKISLDVLGLNSTATDFELTFCEQLVACTGGFATLITGPQDADREFRRLLAATLDTVASGLSLKLKFPSVIRTNDAYRGEPENVYLGKLALTGEREANLPLGLLERSKETKDYIDLIVPPQNGTEGQLQLCLATLFYEIPNQPRTTLQTERSVVIQCINDPSVLNSGNSQVDVGYNIAYIKRLERDLAKARTEAQKALAANDDVGIKRHRDTFVAIILEIIRRCASAGMIEQKKLFEDLLKQAERGELPGLGKINQAVASTTRVSISSDVGAKLRRNPFGKRFT